MKYIQKRPAANERLVTGLLLRGLVQAFVKALLEGLPDDGERQPLEAVRDNSRAQSAPEEAGKSILFGDHFQSLAVRNGRLVRLFGRFDHTQAVAAAVRDDGRAEADDGVAPELLERLVRVRLRDLLLQEVEREEPRETKHGDRVENPGLESYRE